MSFRAALVFACTAAVACAHPEQPADDVPDVSTTATDASSAPL